MTRRNRARRKFFPFLPRSLPSFAFVLKENVLQDASKKQKKGKIFSKRSFQVETSLDAARKNGYSLSVASLTLRLLTMLTPLRRLRFSDVDDFNGFNAANPRVFGAAPRSVKRFN